jgi:TonB family protein
MRAFNAAVKAGDYKTAAAEAKTTWPSWNKTDPDTAIVAREFGFASYVAGDYAAARDYGQFLKDQGAGLAKPDDQPATSAVLLAASEYRLGVSTDTRARLYDALAARAAGAGFDNISFLAADNLMARDFDDAHWRDAENSARLASRIVASAGPAYEPQLWTYKMYAAVAAYLFSNSRGSYRELIDVHEGLIDAIDKAPSDAAAARLAPIFWQAKAWRSSMHSHIRSSYTQLSHLSFDEKWDTDTRHPERPSIIPPKTPDDTPCRTTNEFEHPLKYPTSALFRGFVGTVIVKLDVDAQGKPSNVSTLAAIPQKTFGEAVLKMVGEMTVKPDKKKYDASRCTLARQNKFIEFKFTMR